MNTTLGSRLLVAGLLTTLAPLAGAAPRVLVESTEAQVRLEGELRCSRPAEVTVLASDPALFRGDSVRLQSLLDATRALLGFECRNLPGMVVTGRLKGLDSTAYQALAGPQDAWRLQASRTVQVSSLDAGVAPAWSQPAATRASVAVFAVRDLRRGMGVQDSMNALRKSFAGEPRYDAGTKLLSVVEGGCPMAGEYLRREFSLRAGDACLEAKFRGDGTQQLDRLSFGQVVDKDQSGPIRSVLEQRYGRPAQASQPAPATTLLGWGQPLPGRDGRYELEAQIDVHEATTVLVLRLQGAEDAPRYKVDF